MKILLVNHYAGSPFYGMEFRPYYFAREWINSGHEVKIIAADYAHVRKKQPELLNKKSSYQNIDGIDYIWLKTTRYQGNGIRRVFNIFNFLFRLWMQSNKLASEFKPDVVVASSTYPMDIWPCKKIADAAGAKLIYEVHDLWPLSPIELGGMSKHHPFIRIVQRAEDFAVKNCDLVISMLPGTQAYFKDRGLHEKKWVHIPNGVDLSQNANNVPLPPQINTALQLVKAKKLPIFCYAGAFGLANDLDTYLDLAKNLASEAEFILVGHGPEKDRLAQRINSESLTNVTILDPISKDCVQTLLNEIDVAYIGLLDKPLFQHGVSPNKVFDYMRAGKPILQVINTRDDVVTNAKCGVAVKSGQFDDVVAGAKSLLSLDQNSRYDMGLRGRSYVEDHHSNGYLASRMVKMINEVCK